MRDVLIRYNRGERIKLTQKIVSELSLANFWGSFFSAFMSTWMVPKDSGDYLATGSTDSCTAQGFLDSFFYGVSVLMNAILALTYCIIVKRGRRDEARSRRSLSLVSAYYKFLTTCLPWTKYEFLLSLFNHVITQILGLPPIICLLLAMKPLFDQAYNYTDFHVCSIAEYPLGCIFDDDIDCIRGENAWFLKIARFACVCLANLTIVVSVCILIKHYLTKERRTTSHAMQNANEFLLSNKATRQGIWYVVAFMFCWYPWYVWQWIRITSEMKTLSSDSSPVLFYMISITYPLQVYFRPRYLKFRERDSEELRLASIFRALDVRVPTILSRSNDEDIIADIT
ncbi:hypothetical protein ACHAXR_009245 [Thalassiosira sp. AJA248-18]